MNVVIKFLYMLFLVACVNYFKSLIFNLSNDSQTLNIHTNTKSPMKKNKLILLTMKTATEVPSPVNIATLIPMDPSSSLSIQLMIPMGILKQGRYKKISLQLEQSQPQLLDQLHHHDVMIPILLLKSSPNLLHTLNKL